MGLAVVSEGVDVALGRQDQIAFADEAFGGLPGIRAGKVVGPLNVAMKQDEDGNGKGMERPGPGGRWGVGVRKGGCPDWLVRISRISS